MVVMVVMVVMVEILFALHCTALLTGRGSCKDHIDIEYKEGKQSLILRLALFVQDIDLDVI